MILPPHPLVPSRSSARAIGAAPGLPPLVLFILIAMIAGAIACQPPQAAPPPNLLLITVDTLRADRLACYGGEADVGGAICSIGEGGTRFQWAISPAPSTAPAIASILTSRYPSYHGVTQSGRSVLSNDATTLAEELARAGYATGAVVSNPVLGPRRQLQQGFGTYDTRMDRVEKNRPRFRERAAASATDSAVEWLAQATEPWFLWVHYQDPHGPYEPPGAPPTVDKPGARTLPHLRDHSGRAGIPAYQALTDVFSIEAYERRYLDEIRYLDHQIARLLKTATMSERDIGIALTADHGEAFGEDGYWFAHGHSVGFDQVRVPLLLKTPSTAERSQIAIPVTTLDIAPTFLLLANVDLPNEFMGRPLSASDDADAPTKDSNRVLYSEHRARAGVLAGNVYYTRDRDTHEAGRPDHITGGLLEVMEPARVQLDITPTGSEFSRQPVDPETELARALESLMSDFLTKASGHRESSEPEVQSEMPVDLQQQLEALGYLE